MSFVFRPFSRLRKPWREYAQGRLSGEIEMAYEHFKYVVEIKQIGQETTNETKQFATKREPTEIKTSGYNGRDEVTYKEEFEVRDVPQVKTHEWQVYRQECSKLDIKAVIDAVNAKPKE
jgi:hypothetical protein